MTLSERELPRQRVVGFLRYLRTQGFVLGVNETLDTLSTLSSCDLTDARFVKHTIRTLTCRDHAEWKRFDVLFGRYWFSEQSAVDEDDVIALIDPRVRRRRRGVVGLGSATSEPNPDLQRPGVLATGAGRQSMLTRADYRFLNDKIAMREAETLAEKLARLLKTKSSRRKIIGPLGRELDIRRTLRRNLSSGGLPVTRLYRRPRPDPTKLVLLHDISHSMSWHNPLLYRFVRGIVRAVPSAQAFAFHTKLFRVTEIYRERSLDKMRQRLEADNKLWLGGTCIAESVRQFIDSWAREIVTSRCVVVILSDGFDTDTPEELGNQLRCLRSSSGPVLWLNPMLGREGYRLDATASNALAPHVESFLPAHSIDALRTAVVKISQLARA